MRMSILFEGLEDRRSLLEDGEGGGDAGGTSNAGIGLTTTADVAMHPMYLGFSYRGGTVNLRGRKRKRKRARTEALDQSMSLMLEQYSNRLAKAKVKLIIE